MIRLFEGVDFSGLVSEVENNTTLFDQFTVRQSFDGSPHKQTKSIPLRTNYSDGIELADLVNEKEANETPFMEHFPLCYEFIMELGHHLKSERLGSALLVMLFPNSKIEPHEDHGEYYQYYDRVHICLTGACHLREGSQYGSMKSGDVWVIDNRKEHEVWNDRDTSRIHLIVDYRLKHGIYTG
ncbi:MAG: aspartyl/asparaginyl beta-hydroxylase domain-containing protein [Thiolinea sp.]